MNTVNLRPYKRATAVVKDLHSLVYENAAVYSAYRYYTGAVGTAGDGIVSRILKTNSNPLIAVVANLANSHGQSCWGLFQKRLPDAISVDYTIIRKLESARTAGEIYQWGFLLAATLLHESVHYALFHKKQSEGMYEYGIGFEQQAWGTTADEIKPKLGERLYKYFHFLSHEISTDRSVIRVAHNTVHSR